VCTNRWGPGVEGADRHLDAPLRVARIVQTAEKNYLVAPGSEKEKIQIPEVISSIHQGFGGTGARNAPRRPGNVQNMFLLGTLGRK